MIRKANANSRDVCMMQNAPDKLDKTTIWVRDKIGINEEEGLLCYTGFLLSVA